MTCGVHVKVKPVSLAFGIYLGFSVTHLMRRKQQSVRHYNVLSPPRCEYDDFGYVVGCQWLAASAKNQLLIHVLID
jgi:hypothetical protein